METQWAEKSESQMAQPLEKRLVTLLARPLAVRLELQMVTRWALRWVQLVMT